MKMMIIITMIKIITTTTTIKNIYLKKNTHTQQQQQNKNLNNPKTYCSTAFPRGCDENVLYLRQGGDSQRFLGTLEFSGRQENFGKTWRQRELHHLKTQWVCQVSGFIKS
jgi:hypothetical protein